MSPYWECSFSLLLTATELSLNVYKEALYEVVHVLNSAPCYEDVWRVEV
jgi:hypothetical protein